MQMKITPHLYFIFGIIIFMLNEGIFGSSGFYGYLFFYLSHVMIIVSLLIIIINFFKKKNRG